MKIFFKRLILISIILSLLGWKLHSLEKPTFAYTPLVSSNICVALNYHYVREQTLATSLIEWVTNTNELKTYTVYTDEFEKQMDILVDAGVYFATLEEVITFHTTQSFPEKCVWISFDDGDRSIYEQAFPILKERNIPFTMFLIAGQTGNPNFNNIDVLGWEELREMHTSGLVSFGSHTYDMHYADENGAIFLNPSLHDAFSKDLALSKQVLEEQLGVPITTFAYPFGNATTEIAHIASGAGFEHSFILAPYGIDYASEPLLLPRFLIDNENFYKIVTPWLETFKTSTYH